LAAAVREFEEETGVRPEGPFVPLGSVRQKAGKLVHAWAWEGEADPGRVRSNPTRAEWPRGRGGG
jgi:predicted NUDIX family NTP pyrophosphohydrolase